MTTSVNIRIAKILMLFVAFLAFECLGIIVGDAQSTFPSTVDIVPTYCAAADVNGSTDNTACVQAALNASCNKTLRMTNGHYLAHDVTVHCPVKLVGATPNGPLASGVIWDYSSATDHGLQFIPSGWPSVTQQNLLFGPRVEGVTFYTSGGSSRGLDFVGINSGSVNEIAFTGTCYNGLRLYGVYKFDVSNVSINYYANTGPGCSNINLELYGDLSGENQSGGSCSLGNCSTRTDIVTIHNFDSLGTTSGSCIYIHDLVFTTIGEHVQCENKNIGLNVECASGYPSISYCPTWIEFTDLNLEGAVNVGIYANDFSEFRCIACYIVGNGSGTNVGANFSTINYNGNGVGGIQLIGGRYSNWGSHCIYVNVPDSQISDTIILDCNLNNTGGNGIQINTANNHKISHNTFCQYLLNSGPAMGAINLSGASLSSVYIDGNSFYTCSAGITGNTPSPGYYTNNLGP